MVWTAILKAVEYNKPTYRLVSLMKKDGKEVEEETIEIEDSIPLEDAIERIKDKLREREAAETLGAELNKQIGKEIILEAELSKKIRL